MLSPSNPRSNCKEVRKIMFQWHHCQCKTSRPLATTKCRELFDKCCETVQSLMHIMYRKYPGSPCSAVQLARRREVLWALCRYRVSVVFKFDPLVRLASDSAVQWSDTPALIRKRGTGFVLMGHGVVFLLLVKTEGSYGNMAFNMPVRNGTLCY